jgi:hypothetical protein
MFTAYQLQITQALLSFKKRIVTYIMIPVLETRDVGHPTKQYLQLKINNNEKEA